jgi:hypothetical protein
LFKGEAKAMNIPLSLPGLLDRDHQLILQKEAGILALLGEGSHLLKQQRLSENELRVLLPILEAFPQACPYEVVVASLASHTATPTAIAGCHLWLQLARQQGTWYQELRPLRRILWSLQHKLLAFHLELSTVRESGCRLTRTSSSNS